jgi:hypothetical protein
MEFLNITESENFDTVKICRKDICDSSRGIFTFGFSFYSHYVQRFVEQVFYKDVALFLSFQHFHVLQCLGLLGNGCGPVCYLVALHNIFNAASLKCL